MVIPAHREAPRVAEVIGGLPAFVDVVVVVDDASDDDTAQVARSVRDPRVQVVAHRVNRGVGAAIATGYTHAFAAGADVAAVMAGDGQMDPADLEAVVQPILEDIADYAKGDRLRWPNARSLIPSDRYLGIQCLSWLTRRVTGLAIHDSQCGYTALSAAAFAKMDLSAVWPRYGYPNDLLGWLALHAMRVKEVPVRPIYEGAPSGIGWRHALFVVPYVLARVLARRLLKRTALPVTEAVHRQA